MTIKIKNILSLMLALMMLIFISAPSVAEEEYNTPEVTE